jgi:hypothetical protein
MASKSSSRPSFGDPLGSNIVTGVTDGTPDKACFPETAEFISASC